MSKRNVPVAAARWEQEADPPDAPRIVREKEKEQPARRPSLAAWTSLLIVWVVWGSTYLAIRVGDQTIPPLLLAAVRFLLAGLESPEFS